jgi:hypothetical protein
MRPPSLPVDTSPASAALALRGLFDGIGDELIELSVKNNHKGGKWKSVQMDLPELLRTVGAGELEAWSRGGRDIYFGAIGLTERPDKEWRRGGAALRGTGGALWLDIDCQAPGREGPGYFEHVEEAVAKVDTALRELGGGWGQTLVDSTLVMHSGWGVQYWIPLKHRVPAVECSRLVRVLCGAVDTSVDKKVDHLWDVTRVMRMPATWNWRAGGGEGEATPTGVVRWPTLGGRGGRLSYEEIVDVLSGHARGYWSKEIGAPTGWVEEQVDKLLETWCGVEAVSEEGGGEDWFDWDEGFSIEEIADRIWTWEQVLEPKGWTKDEGDHLREDVWLRPGKAAVGGGAPKGWGATERSAVVYKDKPELLVVYSDSHETGFSKGLRGGGRRGDAAGVGVISKWRAWVDLNYAGDTQEALRDVWSGKAGVPELTKRLQDEAGWMVEAGEELAYQRAVAEAGGTG